MVAVATVIRKTPAKTVRDYFAARNIPISETLWGGDDGEIAKPLIAAIDALEPDIHSRVVNDTGRVGALADEAGQIAIYSVAPDPKKIDGLANGFERAMWLFIHEPSLFQRAEEVRYTDERRRGRYWDGYVGDPDVTLRRDDAAITAFKDAIRERFGSKNVHVEIFDRHRGAFNGEDHSLIQATVYSEARLEEYLEFIEGTLNLRGRHPVIEAALTYEPNTGVIEVVAGDRETRDDYVRLFARDLLGIELEQGERLALRRYDLKPLLKPHAFPTEPGDKIESVKVNSLRLMPLDAQSERVTLECLRGEKATIWEMAASRFGDHNPLHGGWVITQARLTIRFHPEKGASRAKVLPLTLSMPSGCDLKDRTERELLIGEKYLREWGLVGEL